MNRSPTTRVAHNDVTEIPVTAVGPGPPQRAAKWLFPHSRWQMYALAIAAVLSAALLRWLLSGLAGNSSRFTLFYPAIILASYMGGLGPGLLATLLAALMGSILFAIPPWQFQLGQPAPIMLFGLFLATSVFICLLGGLIHRAQRQLQAETRAAREAQAALSDSERRFHSIFSQAAVGICLATSDGRMMLANQKLCTMLGYRPEELLQRTYQEITYPEDWPAQVVQARRLQAGEIDSYSMEKRYIRKDGSLLWANLTCSAIRGDPIYVVAVVEDITCRKQAEEALKQVQDRYSALFDRSRDCVYIHDFEGHFLDANPAVLELMGYTREEVTSLNVSSVLEPDQTPRFMQAMDELRRMNHLQKTAEFRVRRKNGEPVIVEVKASVIFRNGQPTAVQGIARDITERTRMEEALRESEEKFRSLAENAHAAFGIVQGKRFVYANRYFAALSGYTRDEILNMDFDQMVHPAFRGMMLDRARRRQLGEPVPSNYEFKMLTKSGEERWVDFSPARTIYRGKPAIIGTGFDITERKRAEAALRESEARLAEAKEAAEAASRAKDQFLAVLSHELRTPLTPVLAAATILAKDHRVPPEILDDLEMIRRNVALEARLIDDLLDLTRISRGKLELRPQPVDACAVLRHAVEICSADIDAKNLHLSLDLTSGNRWLRADPSRLQQIFWNLINNAIKFTPPGGCIGVRCFPDPQGRAVIEVSDNGAGIDPQILPRIFAAFEQGSRLVTKQFGGLGLGLAISKALVDLHGGTITAESLGKGKGAIFRVVLPAAGAAYPHDTPPPSHATAAPAPKDSPEHRRILLVEDHKDTARIIGQLLKAGGHQVETADTVESALHLATTHPYDLLISDLGLPDGNGLDLMRQLRARAQPLKGIALSGYGMDEDIARSREAGFAEHLVKPINFDHLEAAIVRVMAL